MENFKVVKPPEKVYGDRYRVIQFGENYYIYDYKVYDLVKDDEGAFFKRKSDKQVGINDQGKSEADQFCSFLTRKHKISYLKEIVQYQKYIIEKEMKTCQVNQEQPTI